MHKCKGKARRNGSNKRRDSAEYWEKRLKTMGLGMDAGAQRATVTYGHMIADFGEWQGRIVFSPPSGERLDEGEWPTLLV